MFQVSIQPKAQNFGNVSSSILFSCILNIDKRLLIFWIVTLKTPLSVKLFESVRLFYRFLGTVEAGTTISMRIFSFAFLRETFQKRD